MTTPVLQIRDNSIALTGGSRSLANQQASYGKAIYLMKAGLVKAGWTVYYSSNGLTSGNQDLWTSDSFLACPLQSSTATVLSCNASSDRTIDGVWCCLRSPTADANGDYLHICLSPSVSFWGDMNKRGADNSISSSWYGSRNGCIKIGLILSPNESAFSNGYVHSSVSTLPENGQLPSLYDAEWISFDAAGNDFDTSGRKSIAVISSGNQFSIIFYNNAYADRKVVSLCNIEGGGYAIFQTNNFSTSCDDSNHTTYSRIRAGLFSDLGNCSGQDNLYCTKWGTYPSVYIKRIDGTVYSGPLADPVPAGFEAWTLAPYIDGNLTTPRVSMLRALSANDTNHFDLGEMSDWFVVTSAPASDLTILRHSDGRRWFTMKFGNYFYAMRWGDDDPNDVSTMVGV